MFPRLGGGSIEPCHGYDGLWSEETITMSCYRQRRQQRLADPEFAAGYQEMDDVIQRIGAKHTLREQVDVSTLALEKAEWHALVATPVSQAFLAMLANEAKTEWAAGTTGELDQELAEDDAESGAVDTDEGRGR